MYAYRARRERGEVPRRRIDLDEHPAEHERESHNRNFITHNRAGTSHFPRRFEDRDRSFREFKNNSRRLGREDAPPKARIRATYSQRWNRNEGRGKRRLPTIFDFIHTERDFRETDFDNRRTNQDFRNTDFDLRETDYDNRERNEFTHEPITQNKRKNRKGHNRKLIRWTPRNTDFDFRKTDYDFGETDYDNRENRDLLRFDEEHTANTDARVDLTWRKRNEFIHEPINQNKMKNRKGHNRKYTRWAPPRGPKPLDVIDFDEESPPRYTQREYYNSNIYNYNTRYKNRDRGNRFPPGRERQGGRQRYFDQSKHNGDSVYTPPSPKLKLTMKLMYELTRTVHHLQKITIKVTNNTPRGFKRLTELLINTVKPAAPTRRTAELLVGNAKNWMYNTQVILEEHYEKEIDRTIVELKERTDQDDWKRAFEVACNWARKNYRNKITEEVFEKTEALFLAHMTTERNGGGKRHNVRAPTSTITDTRVQDQIMEVTQRETVNAQTSPILVEQRTPPTNRGRGEWSFDEEDFPPLEPPAIVPTPVRPQAPLEQRTPRRIYQRLLLEEDKITELPSGEINTEKQARPPTTEGGNTIKDGEITTREGVNEIMVQENTLRHNRVITVAQVHQPPVTARPSLTRVESSPFLFSEGSNEGSLTDIAPHSALTRFLEENADEIGQIDEAARLEKEKGTEFDRVLEQVLPGTPETPRSLGRPSKHVQTTRKNQDWSLNLKRKYVIIGDSNVGRISTFNHADLQIDCFPGAKFQHAGNLMEKATIAMEPELLIFSLGINNRAQRCIELTIKEIHRTYRMARSRLPHTALYFPLINFSEKLPLEEQVHLEKINKYIRDTLVSIEELPKEEFVVEEDGIHWTAGTAKAMLNHWIDRLNFP